MFDKYIPRSCTHTALEAGVTYTQVAAGGCHIVLLRGDGTAVAFGYDGYGQCKVPALRAGLSEDAKVGSIEHLSNIYRTFIEHLLNLYRTPIEQLLNISRQLSNIYRNLSSIYRTSIEHLSNLYRVHSSPRCLCGLYRASIEHLSGIYRASIEQPGKR